MRKCRYTDNHNCAGEGLPALFSVDDHFWVWYLCDGHFNTLDLDDDNEKCERISEDEATVFEVMTR